MPATTVLSVFNLRPRRIGGIETMWRELSVQLGQLGWTSVLCFRDAPPPSVREFLDLPNVHLETADLPAAWSLKSTGQLASLIRKHNPTVLHLNFLDMLAPYTWLAKLMGVRKVFYTDHISQPESFTPRRVTLWKKSIYRTVAPVSGVFCVSDYLRCCWAESERMPVAKLKTVYNGVDIARCRASSTRAAAFRAQWEIPQDAVLVAQVASMIPEKGFRDVLKAARRVIEAVPDAYFLLVGDGPQRDEYVAQARQLGIAHRVQFTGLIGDPVGEGLFAASDVVCQASRWNEAFGLVIAEAMACGAPVVGTRVGGIPELIQDGETGYLVERGDVETLANRIIQLAGNADLRFRLGEHGRERCRRLFDHRQVATTIIEHYDLHGLRQNALSPAVVSGKTGIPRRATDIE